MKTHVTTIERETIDNFFNDWNKQDRPGCAIGVIRDGEIVYSNEYGMSDLEHDMAINRSSVFYIGSVSKQFTAFCILLLAEQEKLNFDDKIQKYLQDFPEYEYAITINHLIYHTSGIKNYSDLVHDMGKSYLDSIGRDEIYRLIKEQKELNFHPGTSFEYNNSGYFLLGMIVEKITKQSLKEFAHNNIFKPLGMNSTFYCDDNAALIKNRVFGYEVSEVGFKNAMIRSELVGAGGIYSCVEDLFLWDKNFYDNILGKGGEKIIQKMQVEGILQNGEKCKHPYGNYARGIVIGSYRGQKTVSHGGVFAGYRAELIRFPEQRLSVIMLCNRSDAMPTKKSLKIVDILYPEF